MLLPPFTWLLYICYSHRLPDYSIYATPTVYLVTLYMLLPPFTWLLYICYSHRFPGYSIYVTPTVYLATLYMLLPPFTSRSSLISILEFFPDKGQSTRLRIWKPIQKRSRGSTEFPNQKLRQIGLGVYMIYDRTNKQKDEITKITTL